MSIWDVYSPTNPDFKLGQVQCGTAAEALQKAKEKFGGTGHGVIRADIDHHEYAWVESKTTGLWVYKRMGWRASRKRMEIG
jgi:hypothetical protein